MPVTPEVSIVFRAILCCSIFKRRQEQQDPQQPQTEGSDLEYQNSDLPAAAAASDQGPFITTSEDAEGEELEEAAPEENSDEIPSSPPVLTMFSPLSLYKIQQACTDLQSLKASMPPSNMMNTRAYRNTILHIYDILQRDEIIELYGAVGSYYLTEKLRIVETVLEMAYWDVDSGGDSRLVGWIERVLGEIVEENPSSIPALTLLGRSWLLKAQQYLSKISEDGSSSNTNSASSHGSAAYGHGHMPFTDRDWTAADEDRDAAEHDRRREEGLYVDARTCLIPAVEFLRRAVRRMERTEGAEVHPGWGDVYVLQAEVNMSLGNVTVSSQAQRYFRTAVEALQKASMIDGFGLPEHLERYLRSYEFILY